MNLSHVSLYRYAIPFTEPITVKRQRLVQREGVVLALHHAAGEAIGYGEIAPLLGLHRESLEQAEAQVVGLLARRTITIPCMMQLHLYPSVRTGLEMAIINLHAALSGVFPSFLGEVSGDGDVAAEVPVNALLFGDTPQVVQRAERYFDLGYRTFKLKVNVRNCADAITSIRELHRIFGNCIELRIDANQSFTLDEALAFASMIPEGSIAYIEEPLQEVESIGEFFAKTGIRSALDETLWQKPALLATTPNEALAALILKPNRLGGVVAALNLARYAREHHLLAVFSSAFESGISLSFYAWLAASTASTAAKPAACGLDTYRYLRHDLLTTPFGAERALLNPHKLYRDGATLNHSTLRRTSLWTM